MGITNHFQTAEEKNKEDEATIAGEIIVSAGDESPLSGGEERGSVARLLIHHSNVQQVQVLLLGSTGTSGQRQRTRVPHNMNDKQVYSNPKNCYPNAKV